MVKASINFGSLFGAYRTNGYVQLFVSNAYLTKPGSYNVVLSNEVEGIETTFKMCIYAQ